MAELLSPGSASSYSTLLTGMFRTQNKTLIEVHGRSQGKSCIGLHSLAIAPLKFSR